MASPTWWIDHRWLRYQPDFNLGDILTALTLLGSFIAWVLLTRRQRREQAEERRRSGALRLLLYILRNEAGGNPIRLDDLKARFNRPDMRERRIAYCGRDWQFKDDPTFEAAVYRLDWEGKIDWVGVDQIKFRS